MPRALAYAHLRMPAPPEHREAVLVHLRTRRDIFAAEGCRYWLFRSENEESVIEFFEASDATALAAACQRAGLAKLPIYTEMELS